MLFVIFAMYPQCEFWGYVSSISPRDLKFFGSCIVKVLSLEEILSISTGLATRPSRLAPKKCINKSIWLATGGAPSMGTPQVPSGCQQIDLFMHFLGARVLMASVEMDKISSSAHCHVR